MSVEAGKEFIEHFGIKGMRWGVRKERAVSTDVHLDTGIRRRQTKVRTKGGASHPASDDAIRAAVQKQKLKKSGTAALSTDELRDLATRLDLEARVEVLATSKGKRFVQKQVEQEGQQQLRSVGRKAGSAAGEAAVKKAKKAAAVAATTAALA